MCPIVKKRAKHLFFDSAIRIVLPEGADVSELSGAIEEEVELDDLDLQILADTATQEPPPKLNGSKRAKRAFLRRPTKRLTRLDPSFSLSDYFDLVLSEHMCAAPHLSSWDVMFEDFTKASDDLFRADIGSVAFRWSVPGQFRVALLDRRGVEHAYSGTVDGNWEQVMGAPRRAWLGMRVHLIPPS